MQTLQLVMGELPLHEPDKSYIILIHLYIKCCWLNMPLLRLGKIHGKLSVWGKPQYKILGWVLNSLLTYLLTYLLTPWCRVLPEQLTGLQLVKKFPAFQGTRRFITALTSVRHSFKLVSFRNVMMMMMMMMIMIMMIVNDNLKKTSIN